MDDAMKKRFERKSKEMIELALLAGYLTGGLLAVTALGVSLALLTPFLRAVGFAIVFGVLGLLAGSGGFWWMAWRYELREQLRELRGERGG